MSMPLTATVSPKAGAAMVSRTAAIGVMRIMGGLRNAVGSTRTGRFSYTGTSGVRVRLVPPRALAPHGEQAPQARLAQPQPAPQEGSEIDGEQHVGEERRVRPDLRGHGAAQDAHHENGPKKRRAPP